MTREIFNSCRERYRGKSILVVGNGPSAKKASKHSRKYDYVVTVNAGLFILSEQNVTADLLWVQDGRMFVGKQDKVLPFVHDKLTVFTPVHVLLPSKIKLPRLARFSHLGNRGFSKDPRLGAFTGYSAVYGLMQLLNWFEPKRLGFIGVDLDYSRNNTRAYQTRRGLDVDLHVNDQQISYTLHAFDVLRANGIAVENHSDSKLLAQSVTLLKA